MSKEFKRTSAHIKIKLGKNNKRKQKWRRARGRHNKIREKKRGHAAKPSIGRRSNMKIINEKIIHSEREIISVKKGDKVIISSLIGRKKKKAFIEKLSALGAIIKNPVLENKK